MPNRSRKWIFIRGLGRHSAHWGPFLDEFKKNFPHDEIEMMDLRGNGTMAHSSSYLSILENVRDLRSRSKMIQNGESVYLMTISLGSMVGTEWANRYPNEVLGLVTINTSDKGTASILHRMRPSNYLRVLAYFRMQKSPLEMELELLNTTTNHLADKEAWAEKAARFPPTSRLNFARQMAAAGTYEFPKHKPRTEVLLLCSDGDRLVHPECTKRIGEMWVTKPHIHPTAGHDIPMEDPQWVCDQIHHWFEALPEESEQAF